MKIRDLYVVLVLTLLHLAGKSNRFSDNKILYNFEYEYNK